MPAKSIRISRLSMTALGAALRASLWNPGFFCGVLLLTAVFLAAGEPYAEYLIESGGSMEGAAWIAVFAYSVSSEQSLMFLPLVVPLAASAEVQDEIKSRYALFLAGRSGKKSYLADRIIGTACAGGFVSVLAMSAVLLAAAVRCAGIPDLSAAGEGITAWSLLPDFLCGFLNGALWSLIGSAAAVITRSRYLAYAVPFVLSYVLNVFQERYYPELFFLSPKQWAFPSYYGAGTCIGILIFLGLAVSAVLGRLMERRLS